MKHEKKFTTVSIPTPLFRKIGKAIEGTGFPSASSYVTFVLREVLGMEERSSSQAFTKQDEDRIKEKLRNLGYI
jgi:Arc/MetJ-type ribon-helix-helix transcriptional regulator